MSAALLDSLNLDRVRPTHLLPRGLGHGHPSPRKLYPRIVPGKRLNLVLGLYRNPVIDHFQRVLVDQPATPFVRHAETVGGIEMRGKLDRWKERSSPIRAALDRLHRSRRVQLRAVSRASRLSRSTIRLTARTSRRAGRRPTGCGRNELFASSRRSPSARRCQRPPPTGRRCRRPCCRR